MNLILPIILLLTTSSLSFASHWGAVEIPEITLKHPEAQVTLKTELKTGKLEKIEVIIGENTIKLPKEELAGINQVDTSSVQLVTSFGQGSSESRSKLTDTLVISLKFGPVKYHADEESLKIIPVYSVAHFTFKSSKYIRRNIAKPIGDYKNLWKLFEKESGEKEIPDGDSEDVTAPF